MFPSQKFEFEKSIRLANEPGQYFTLKIFRNGELIGCFSSKSENYLNKKIPAGATPKI